jgi:hypothetical protein
MNRTTTSPVSKIVKANLPKPYVGTAAILTLPYRPNKGFSDLDRIQRNDPSAGTKAQIYQELIVLFESECISFIKSLFICFIF